MSKPMEKEPCADRPDVPIGFILFRWHPFVSDTTKIANQKSLTR
jgi:hypothetical protein